MAEAPYVEIKDMYSPEEVDDIMFEFEFFRRSNVFADPEHTGAAAYEDGTLKKKNKAVFLDSVYTNRDNSLTLKHNRKLFSLLLDSDVLGPISKALQMSNADRTLISYYEDSDYYAPHTDRSVLTALTYFYKQPKRFSGGELVLPEYNCSLPPTHNTTYIFAGLVEHGVNPITMDEQFMGLGFGRYCMAQFLQLCDNPLSGN
jgi:predicted 2-oxoglutarate/Fe(II)-dependent dioxygenase YbiX